MKKPMVSALMLTKNRFKLFKEAVQNFIDQTYEYKELVIIDNGSKYYNMKVDKYLNGLNANIKHIKIPSKTLGEMRNIGIQNCTGDFIIIFDDDDVHHPLRIEKQLEYMLKTNIDATLLSNFVASFKKERYLCNFEKGLEGTMMFKHPGESIKYSGINQGEDTMFKKSLEDNGYIIVVLNIEHELYEYKFHGSNTVSAKHFKDIIKQPRVKKITLFGL
jgi:glycosyltransferase involved in cell wall biosynthesis